MKLKKVFEYTPDVDGVLAPLTLKYFDDCFGNREASLHPIQHIPLRIKKGQTIVVMLSEPETPFQYWPGGENPAPGKIVEVVLRTGLKPEPKLSDDLSWHHEECADTELARLDVIAWRLAED